MGFLKPYLPCRESSAPGQSPTLPMLQDTAKPSPARPIFSIDTSAITATLSGHKLYDQLQTEASLQLFMRTHVFCVWDFQCLLKSLQRLVTCVDVPWFPTADAEARRLVNEIVLEEESDELPGGGFLSHFELYLMAMKECGADTGPILRFLDELQGGKDLDECLSRSYIPAGAREFVKSTLTIAESGEVHRIAAAFSHGREDIIPVMFRQIVQRLAGSNPGKWETLRYYLDRHVSHDAEVHGPAARALVGRLCGEDTTLWAEAQVTAADSLAERAKLWDALLTTVTAGSVAS